MPGFNAGDVVEPLDYDFTKFGGEKGTIPEPTEKVLTKFLREITELSTDIAKRHVDLPEDAPAEKIAEMAQELQLSDIVEELFEGMTRIYSETLCQGKPSVEQLELLPMRVGAEFFRWVSTETRPEIFGAATTPSRPELRVVRGA